MAAHPELIGLHVLVADGQAFLDIDRKMIAVS